MGVTVRERNKGEYWVFINHNGKRKAKKVGDKKAAHAVARKIREKLALGQLILSETQKKPSFKEYADLWLEGYIKTLRKQSTYERYKGILYKYIYPAFKDRPINKITRGDIRNFLLSLNKKGCSKSTICLIRDVISGPMGNALDDEIINANPAVGVIKRLQLERSKKLSVEPMTQDEVELFLKTCAENSSEYYTFFLCAFRTGMRLGELLALQWGDVDWNRNFIRVERSYRKGILSTTKTGEARRVDMSGQLSQSLKGFLTQQKRQALKQGKSEPVEIIFHHNSRHMEQNYIRRVYKRILKKAGIREMRFYDIRHTFASLLLSNGESPVYVKEQLGHSSIQMTVDVYGHLIPSSNRAAVDRLDMPDLQHMDALPKDTISGDATIRNLYAT